MQHLLRLALGTAIAFVFCTGCAFIEAASEQLIGEGQIPRFDEEILYPSIDELTGMTQDDVAAFPGFPSSLAAGTFAHLQGAFAITGECSKTIEVPLSDNEALLGIEVTVTNCPADDRCADHCDDGFFGMAFESRVELQLLTQEKADKLRDLLSELTPDAVAQLRLRFYELELFQTDADGDQYPIHDWIEAFSLGMESQSGESIVVLDETMLDRITSEDPQRFDIDGTSAYTQQLKEEVLAGEPVSTFVVQRMRIPQPNLYELVFDGAGLRFDLQPEFVISVLEVVQSKI